MFFGSLEFSACGSKSQIIWLCTAAILWATLAIEMDMIFTFFMYEISFQMRCLDERCFTAKTLAMMYGYDTNCLSLTFPLYIIKEFIHMYLMVQKTSAALVKLFRDLDAFLATLTQDSWKLRVYVRVWTAWDSIHRRELTNFRKCQYFGKFLSNA